MRFSLNWLKEFLDTTATPAHIAETLVRLGLEVEAVEDTAKAFNNVVIGRVLTRAQHPDADRLGVCTVDVGAEAPRQIVCGAPNARTGITVAVALEGASLPCGITIVPTKIRGIQSNGMMCSTKELGLGDDHAGIMELTTDAPTGTPFADAQGYSDVLFDISITPNRADALGVFGVARELAAAGLGTLKAPFTLPENAPAAVEQPQALPGISSANCAYFGLVTLTGLDNNTPSPAWLKKHLEAAGCRSINPVVDVTNYVCLSYGQPLHAYDAALVNGSVLTAGQASEGEAFEALNDQTYQLSAGDLVIADGAGTVALAGVMGGKRTAVSESTHAVYLEGALFNKSSIALTGQRLALNSDARYRFERGVDPLAVRPTLLYAARLIAHLCGGAVSTLSEAGSAVDARPPILFNPTMVETRGGLTLSTAEISDLVQRAGFTLNADSADVWHLTPPSYRTHMDTPEDVLEEVLRLKGYDCVPAVLPPLPAVRQSVLTPSESALLKAERQTRRLLAEAGYLETLTYSFISKEHAETFSNGAALQTLANPIDAATMSTLRPSLLPGLLNAAARNLARSEVSVQLAEVGRVFRDEQEFVYAAAVTCGTPVRHWNGAQSQNAADVFSAKADALTVMQTLGYAADKLQIRSADTWQGGLPSYWHPTRSGVISLGKTLFGVFGELHPAVAKAFDLSGRVAMFELNLNAISAMSMKKEAYKTSDFQPVTRDFAVVLPLDTAAGDVLQTVKAAEKDLIKNVTLFDVYMGDKLPQGQKSLAFAVTLQAADRTLTEADITPVSEAILGALGKRFGAVLRG